MAAVTRSASGSPSIVANSIVDPNLFPLKSINDVVKLFKRSLELYHTQGIEPDITLLSIVAGYVELSLTTGDAAQHASAAVAALSTSNTINNSNSSNVGSLSTLPGICTTTTSSSIAVNNDIIAGNSVPFPIVTYELVSGLYKKFQSILSGVDKPKISSTCNSRQASRDVIKKVSDVIWHSLIRSTYKDRAHLQNLYCYLSGNKLDGFGMALAVVAGCQLLGYRDVRLAISEDHAWVVFGNKKLETIEVTWHGKSFTENRGQDITTGIESGSWLYLGGLAVVCDKPMEVAAIASAINYSLSTNSDCVEVFELHQRLLWLLYDMGHLRKYPTALGTLGELEEINPTPNRRSCEELYREAIDSAQAYYDNHHVYPYTYQGNFYYRLNKYREAFGAWANAADVIRLYTYQCKNDDEIYKELLDIANEMIPSVMKTESSGHSARSILRDSEVFANLLRFYDGICQWEEDSQTPILHIGWAKPLVNNICKFDYDVRSQVVIKVPEDEPQQSTSSLRGGNNVDQHQSKAAADSPSESRKDNNLLITSNQTTDKSKSNTEEKLEVVEKEEGEEEKLHHAILADLTAACGEKILNPEFLLQGGGQPFAADQQQKRINNNNKLNHNSDILSKDVTNGENKCHNNKKVPINADISHQSMKNNNINVQTTIKNNHTILNATSEMTTGLATGDTTTNQEKQERSEEFNERRIIINDVSEGDNHNNNGNNDDDDDDDPIKFMLKRPVITLYSQKMKGLRDLLLAEKLNTHAISLQVTAQSVACKKVRGIDKMGNHTSSSVYASSVYTNAGNNQQAELKNYDGSSESIAVTRAKRSRRE